MKPNVEINRLIRLIVICFFILLKPVFSSGDPRSAAASSADEAKFKIGFEFQEINNLCDWATNMFVIQKKPIFSVSKDGIKLWEVVIDGKDIEFVTVPFSNGEEYILNASIRTISMAFKLLCDFKEGRNPGSITFDHWINGGALVGAEGRLVMLAATPLERKSVLEGIQKGLRRMLEEDGFRVEIDTPLFERIKDFPFKNSDIAATKWRQQFQPQVTIQHPLEKSIPLISALFMARMGGTLMEHIAASMPLNKDGGDFTKADGLLFLHALTCSDLTTEIELDDRENIKWIADRFKEGEQIDAKVKLNFLSRRPFSNMWGESRHSSALGLLDLYRTKVFGNKLFISVPEKINFINYAEEFYKTDASAGAGSLVRLKFAPSSASEEVDVDFSDNIEADFRTDDARFLLSLRMELI